jgi:Plant specific mitochondrial import receptor subunit TOM20
MPRFLHFVRRLPVRLATSCLLLAISLSSTALAQGFGSSKKKITLHRKLPPIAHLDGTAINVQVTGHNVQPDVATALRDMLEAELLKDDHRLRSDDKHPDSVVSCTITEYAPPQAQTSTQSTYVPGSKKPQQQSVTRYSGILKVAYQAKDAHSGRTLDSDNVTAKYDDEFNQYGSTSGGVTGTLSHTWDKLKHGKLEADKPPTAGELRDVLMSDVVSQIASRLVNTEEPVEVLLARGKLDDANKLAESELWTRNLEALETMTPFPSKEDDAYRLYNIGVAYEALAYASEDPKAARKYLDEAAINYGKAIDDKPAEKYFMQPQNRIDTAIAHYKTLSSQPKTVAAADTGTKSSSSDDTTKSGTGSSTASKTKSTPTKSTSSGTGTTTVAKSMVAAPPKKPSGPPLTNDQVIQMVKAGVDEDNIIDTIRSAGAVNFDLSVDGQVKLAQNGVKGKVLTAMKTKARQSTSH